MTFAERIEVEYPLPFAASIWGDPSKADLDKLIKLCLDDLDSDLEIYEPVSIQGRSTPAPKGMRAIASTKLDTVFQGNRFVKADYDRATNTIISNYYPATSIIKRSVTLEDVNGTSKSPLKGARAMYLRYYVIVKMLEKEIAYLTAIDLDSDVGDINIDALDKKRIEYQAKVDTMKEDIMTYSNA